MWNTSRDGQTPAKSLLDLYVISEDGQPITPQRMWMRELVIKRLALGLIGYVFGLLGPVINAGWILLNPDRQCVHDRFVKTLVVVRREAPQLLEDRLRSQQPEVEFPPPAPRGPRVRPPTPIPTAAPVQAQPTPPSAAPMPTSPELEALELERTSLSQTEYERRRRTLLRELEESG